MMNKQFESIYRKYRGRLLRAEAVDVGQWHGQDVSGNPLLVTREVPWVSFTLGIPQLRNQLQALVKPNLPWAEEHFAERVGGKALNPPPSHERWPWAHAQHQEGETDQFSHTYPERMWPKLAGLPMGPHSYGSGTNRGIRFGYGDLTDVVDLLSCELYTRQAYLPIFFPEDTGGTARIGARIPCSLGYHFMVRNNIDGYPVLDCMYSMRSCDFVRHFRDDIYLAGRLLQWVGVQVGIAINLGATYIDAGTLRVHIASLHMMEGDRYKLTEEAKQDGTR